MTATVNCTRCGHPEKDHCKGAAVHTSPKEAQMMSGRGATICVGRHCLQPLCCCTEYVPSGKE